MAFDAYLEIPGVDGESKNELAEGQIEVIGFSFGGQNQSSVGVGGGGGAGVVSLSSLNIMKKTEAGSAVLFQHMCTGQHFDTGKLTLFKSGGDGGPLPYLTLHFRTMFCDSIQWSGSQGGDDIPSESVSFAFEAVKFEYAVQDEKGNAKGTKEGMWDIAVGQAKF